VKLLLNPNFFLLLRLKPILEKCSWLAFHSLVPKHQLLCKLCSQVFFIFHI
jgi:hypothetical protein